MAREQQPYRHCLFRAPGPHKSEQRNIDEVPPEEIAAAATYVLQQQISLPQTDMVRETALVLGFQRTGQTIQKVVEAAITPCLEKGFFCAESGRIRLGP